MFEWLVEKFFLGMWEFLVVLFLLLVMIQNNPILAGMVSQTIHSFITMITGGSIL